VTPFVLSWPVAAQSPYNAAAAGQRGCSWRSGSVFEAPAFIPGFDNFTVMCQAVEECGRHLLTHVDDGERLITVEDAFELFPSQPNTVALLADRSAGSQMRSNALLQASLRMRPDRIIVGELRGDEALTYLEAINSGHGGSASTIHTETAELAIDRLAIVVLQAGTPLIFAEVRQYIQKSIDVIVQLRRVDGRRGIAELHLPN